MIGRNDPCFCGSGKKWKNCHYPDPGLEKKESFEELYKFYLKNYNIMLKTPEEIEGIRKSGHLAAYILRETSKMAKEGVTTQELDDFAGRLHREAGAIPAPLGYGHPPFPKSICTSLNNVICHGIPDNTALKNGDILNIDVTCILDGYYGDCSRMVMVGDVSEERKHLVSVTFECLKRSVSIVKPGIPLSKIGEVIEEYATHEGCSVVNQFVGHGVGLKFHEAPQVPHYKNRLNIPLVPGMTFTIEPMINLGRREAIIDAHDQWTARTIDGKDSAQFEHTILVTDNGHEILTPWEL